MDEESRHLWAEMRAIHGTWHTSISLRNKTCLFVNFQHLFDSPFHETSQNFSLFGQLFITHTKMSAKCLFECAKILQGFTKS